MFHSFHKANFVENKKKRHLFMKMYFVLSLVSAFRSTGIYAYIYIYSSVCTIGGKA
jgi:hypothetical protein